MEGTFQCKQMGKSFSGDGVETHALQDIEVTLEAGDFISIIGPSGSGKSTLLSLIGTLDRPTSGELHYDGKPINKLNSKELSDFRFENIGFIFQQFHLIPTLTALENVMAPLFGRKVPYDKKERAEQLLAQVGLADKAGSLPSQLSGGQQQRVAVARALVHEPKWLLADEPTGNLDTDTGEIIFNLLRSLNEEKGCGVLFVTHDPALAERANRTIEMRDGVIIEDRLVRV
ncbi:ABC transporter ATP-binding protein [Exiguobacterium sp. Leaf187]|uniref:ABC transporter ATP-binding protein n=2 Tax=Exiguobacterium TaxID=33986 RepID=A0A0V8GL99_9BACL|nr:MULTISPECIES: ABC transporter ATP-binding protein [Exiguobacterium]AHA29819.1 macrolide ABC transporter ATP-binding protein [Exiguobacterium sp. MH3]KQS18953.1 ABC transporter ATP-binding protein [Exiguobacterium sp. Leaf187]KSU50970.1 ABC transporter ATP-binding protein [Exiguobacterium enclense]KTR27786.1 ABC transporter ATP-binding protein [Exiguobacterium indicum]KTR62571.1 ABC transporter ATP-binding protein [Exiguobacterium indicum]